MEQKPEKVTLFTSYLPIAPINWGANNKLETFNDTRNEVDNDDNFDDDFSLDAGADETARGPLVWLLELAGSVIQLLWGGFMAIFRPTSAGRFDKT
ncbi:Dinucleotide-utilizing enzyme involved in thiamine biosynthesis [Operophtera brumata]|uniref:Dinucleotide-utilizing enzyme involved in thiamine biosynthesis n=1 Tax=Operophtera brumata TaxID=104452 RepID=A0A0L7LFN6_OPEBR|nr:Dinucleotide-utilizing enzyme involved in thiamine biosynthesis [Operophtera brumata]